MYIFRHKALVLRIWIRRSIHELLPWYKLNRPCNIALLSDPRQLSQSKVRWMWLPRVRNDRSTLGCIYRHRAVLKRRGKWYEMERSSSQSRWRIDLESLHLVGHCLYLHLKVGTRFRLRESMRTMDRRVGRCV